MRKEMKYFSEKSSFTEMKDLLTDQLSSEFLAVISAEILSTFNSLAVKIALTKSALTILHHFLHRAVRAALKNIDLSVSTNFTSQAVRVVSLTHRSHD